MKGNFEEVKMSIYAGMSIFDLIKDIDINIEGSSISLSDKKYLSLYLGVINTKNKITDYLKKQNINIGTFINFKYLKQDEYIRIYNNYFVEIFEQINFESIELNLNYLLSKKVIKCFNKSYGYNINTTIDNSNKQLINAIK